MTHYDVPRLAPGRRHSGRPAGWQQRNASNVSLDSGPAHNSGTLTGYNDDLSGGALPLFGTEAVAATQPPFPFPACKGVIIAEDRPHN